LAQRLRNAEAIDFRLEMAAANVVKKHRRLFEGRAMRAPRQALDRVQNEPVGFCLEDRLEHCFQWVRQRGCTDHGCSPLQRGDHVRPAISSAEVPTTQIVKSTLISSEETLMSSLKDECHKILIGS